MSPWAARDQGAAGTVPGLVNTGDPGDPGDAGTAVAYATIRGNGTVVAAKSKNITDANVDPDTQTGTVCFTGLSFAPRNVMVSGQVAFDGGQVDTVATAYLENEALGIQLNDCVGEVLVRTFDVSLAALGDRPFHIWFVD